MSLPILARAVLVANPGILGLVQAGSTIRVYPATEFPQNPTLPAVTYQGIGKTTTYSQDGAGLVRQRLQVDCWADTYKAAQELARLVAAAFHDFAGEDDGIQDFEAINERDLWEDVPTTSGTRRIQRVMTEFYAYARATAA